MCFWCLGKYHGESSCNTTEGKQHQTSLVPGCADGVTITVRNWKPARQVQSTIELAIYPYG